MTSSLSGEGSFLEVVSFLFGSPVSAYVGSNTIFDIKDTEDKTNISTPMLSWSGKNVVSFGSLTESDSQKTISGGFATTYSSKRGSGGFDFMSSKGGSEFETMTKITTEHVCGEWLVIFPCHLQDKTGKKTVIEYVEYGVYKLPGSDISKAAARVFDKIDHMKGDVLPSSKFVDLIEKLGEVYHSE